MNLGEKIILCRKKAGMSQVDLADALGVSRQSVSKWETDESKPDINKLPALAKVLNVSIDWLLSEEDFEEEFTEQTIEEGVTISNNMVKPFPDWVERMPSFIGNMIKKYGWLYGLSIAIGGAFFTVFGIFMRVLSYNFIFGGNKANYMFTEDDLLMNAYYGDAFFDPFDSINQQAWSGFSAISGFVIGIGVIILIAGIVLAVALKNWGKK